GACADRNRHMKTLPRSFLQTVRRHPFRFAMADGRMPQVRYFDALVKTIFLARRLRSRWRGQEMVGILLPPSIPGALVNLAALLMGKVPVNLNYTSSNESLTACAQQCNLQTVVTSRQFLERVHVQPPAEAIFLEDLAANPRVAERAFALLASCLLPARGIEAFFGVARRASLDDVATIIFSSGSTGDPKGVILTHYNIASTVDQLNQVVMLHEEDRIMRIHRFFHWFGRTCKLCLTRSSGIGIVFTPNPLN